MFGHVILCVFFFCNFAEARLDQVLFKPQTEIPSSSIEGIDGAYVINLDMRPELWHRIEPDLYFRGIENTRFPAVWGLDFSVPALSKFLTNCMTPGQLGCMLSHLSIYQDALQRGLEVIWIMEDDVEIRQDPHILTKLLKELDEIDSEWDILYTDLDFVAKTGEFWKSLAFPLGKKTPFPSRPLSYYTFRANVSKNLQIIRARYGTCSMILSSRGMKKVLHHFITNEDILWPYDIELHYVPDIREYGIINPVATNGHFEFNYSDAGLDTFRHYFYEIDDEHVEYIKERKRIFDQIMHKFKFVK